jgi:predicted nucleic acid-binding protein
LLDTSVVSRLAVPAVQRYVRSVMDPIGLCPVGRLERLYSATSASEYDAMAEGLAQRFVDVEPPDDVFDHALELQRDLAHHHGMWHRVPLPDLFIAVTALANNFGVLHHDADYERIAKVRPLIQRRVG